MSNTRAVEQHNRELEKLYKKAEKDILDKVVEYNKNQQDKSYCATFPLFLKSHEGYENAEIKIMFFGKETNGWYDNDIYEQGKTIEEIRDKYEEFFIAEYCYKHCRQHFWNGIKKIKSLLWKKIPDKNIGYLWNNTVKMGYTGKGKGFPCKFYDSVVKPHLNNIIVKEIEILEPDYIIFLTGPNKYDEILDNIFGNPERKTIEKFSNKELCEIIIPNVKKSFRTYHPSYLYRKNIHSKFFNKITEEITKDLNNVGGTK